MHHARLAVLAALLPACAPLVVAWPPPAALPTQMAPLGPAEVEIGVGASPSIFPYLKGDNWLQGTFVGQAGVGLGHDLSLSVSGGRNLLGPSGAVMVWWWPHHSDWLDAGALLSLGGAWSESTYLRVQAVVDGDGEPVLDASGDPVVTRTGMPYGYATVAPGVGGQLALRAGKKVTFPALLRVSYARTGWSYGLWDQRWDVWVELDTGVRVELGRSLALGLGPQFMWHAPNSAAFLWVSGVASVEGRFGGRR